MHIYLNIYIHIYVYIFIYILIKGKTNTIFKLYVLVLSRTRFRVNPHSIVA